MRQIIKNITIRSIDAKRFVKKSEALKNVKIASSSGITNVQKRDNFLEIGFVYSVDYFPSIASIKIEGELIYEKEDLSKVEIESSKLPKEITGEIHGAILRFCIPEIVIIAKQLDLIPPIPIPNIDFQKGQNKIRDNIYDYR
ncbi:MAG: hypothetical protein ACXQTP_00860 [Candidatus Methanofastidiosia archaeon]